jgi:hypothetical protein
MRKKSVRMSVAAKKEPVWRVGREELFYRATLRIWRTSVAEWMPWNYREAGARRG